MRVRWPPCATRSRVRGTLSAVVSAVDSKISITTASLPRPALTDNWGAARTSDPVSVWRTTTGWASWVPGAISSSIGCGAKARLRSTKASSDGSTGSAEGGWSAALTSRRPTPGAERLELTGYPFTVRISAAVSPMRRSTTSGPSPSGTDAGWYCSSSSSSMRL